MDKIRVEEFIKNGATVENLNRVLTQMYIADDEAKWLEDRQAEYEALYPPFREMTDDEKAEYGESDSYPLVPLKYGVTFKVWLNETKVVKKAVLDDDGNILEPEILGLIREFTPKTSYKDEIDNYFANSKAWKQRLKEEKKEKLDSLVITSNTVLYDANGKALGNIAGVVAIANWNYNKLIASGTSLDDAYKAIYKDITLNWIGADNKVHIVQVESVCEALQASMQQIANILGVNE